MRLSYQLGNPYAERQTQTGSNHACKKKSCIKRSGNWCERSTASRTPTSAGDIEHGNNCSVMNKMFKCFLQSFLGGDGDWRNSGRGGRREGSLSYQQNPTPRRAAAPQTCFAPGGEENAPNVLVPTANFPLRSKNCQTLVRLVHATFAPSRIIVGVPGPDTKGGSGPDQHTCSKGGGREGWGGREGLGGREGWGV